MIKDITIGQYYPQESVIHRLDPRVKLMGTLVYMIALFVVDSLWGYGICAAVLAVVVLLSKVPPGFIFKGLKAIFVILLLTVIGNLFFTPGTVLWQWKAIKITHEGVMIAVKMACRLVLLITGSSMMTLTTTPNQLTDGLEKALKPLGRIRVPVHEIAMMMSIALRFIPILIEETGKIMKAQAARGADFEEGGLIKRVKSYVPILVPLFVAAFRRAYDLALAMEARCYRGGEGRTKLKPLRYRLRDGIAYLLMVGFLGGLITGRILIGL